MNWLALSPYEVAALWSAMAALATWLYLHARLPVRRRVSTLYFWASMPATARQKRRRIRDPWALAAQLLFLLLLIVALANLEWGVASEGRRVAIVLDTSIWSQEQAPGATPLIDKIHQEALRIVDALPPSDSVLLLSAEPGAPPIVPFTTDRALVRGAIVAARPSNTVADVPRALKMGQDSIAGASRGLLAYVGPGVTSEQQAHDMDQLRASMEGSGAAETHAQFLMRLVSQPGPVENHGITRLSVERDSAQPDRWHLLTQVKNYEPKAARVTLTLSVDGRAFVKQPISLGPDELANIQNEFVWAPGGALQADIGPNDSLDADNHATINIPEFHPLRVAVYSGDSGFTTAIRGALDSNPFLAPQFVGQKSDPKAQFDVAIYQGTDVPAQPASNAIYFLGGNAGAGSSPVRVTEWNPHHPVTRWIRTHDVSVRNPAALSVLSGDTVLASYGTPPVPLIIAREQNQHRLVLIGFNPRDTNFLQESAFPLLIAGSMEWLTHSVDELPGSLDVGEIDLPGPIARIFAPSGKEVPFAISGDDAHWIARETGLYRVITPDGETIVAVNIPQLPTHRLEATPSEAAAPEPEPVPQPALDLWRWLLALALIPLWLEWWLYYSGARKRRVAEAGEFASGIAMQDRDPISGRNREGSQAHDPSMVA